MLRLLGPNSIIGGILLEIGLTITGSTATAYGLGDLIALAIIYALGLAVETRLAAGVLQALGRTIRRLPVVGQIHEFASQFVGMLRSDGPVPFGGGLVFVPRDWVKPARLSVDQLTSIYVSMGLTAPDLSRKGA